MGKIVDANVGAFKINSGQWIANDQLFKNKYFIAFYEINHFKKEEGLTNSQLYSKFHNEYKNQLNYPYYFFNPSGFTNSSETSAESSIGERPKPARLYLLSDKDPKGAVYPSLPPLEFNGIDYHSKKVKNLDNVDLHILVKLFLSHYFKDTKKLVHSSNEFWKVIEMENMHEEEGFHCLHIKLSENQKQINGIPTVTRFRLLTQDYLEELQSDKGFWHQKFYTFGEDEEREEYLRELKPSVAKYLIRNNFYNKERKHCPVFIKYTQKDKKATSAYIDLKEEEYTRHGVLYDFINDFRKHLVEVFGVVMEEDLVSHQFEKVNGQGKQIIPIDELHILDNRVKKGRKIANQQVSSKLLAELTIAQLKKIYPKGKYKLHEKKVKQTTKIPLLVLQDCEKADFEKNSKGILQQYTDPKTNLYKKFVNTPKQTLSINPTKSKWDKKRKTFITDVEYLTYDESTIKEHLGKKTQELEVCLNQLTIKHILLNRVPIANDLLFANDPILQKYIFVYDNLALWVNEKQQFEWMDVLEVETKQVSAHFWQKIKAFSNIDKLTIVEKALSQKALPGKNPHDIFKNRYFMFGKNEFAEIALTNEYILYDSPEIRKRTEAMNKQMPVAFFELGRDVSLQLRQGQVATVNQIEEYNNLLKQFYQHVVHYKDFSYHELISTKIDLAWGIVLDKTYHEKRLGKYIAEQIFGVGNLSKVQQLYGFESPKSIDLINVYQGFYINEEKGLYCVGTRHGFKHDLDKALRIRKLIVHQGSMKVKDLIYSMDVLSVRHKQYTVYPYPFNFIKVIKDF